MAPTITWINDGKMAWTLYAGGVAANPHVEISAHPVLQEPMVHSFLLSTVKFRFASTISRLISISLPILGSHSTLVGTTWIILRSLLRWASTGFVSINQRMLSTLAATPKISHYDIHSHICCISFSFSPQCCILLSWGWIWRLGVWPAHTEESSATIWNAWIIDNLIGFLAFTIDFTLLSAYKLQPVIPNFTNRVSSVGIYFNLSIVKILPTVRYPIIFEHHPVFPLQILTSYTSLYWIPESKKAISIRADFNIWLILKHQYNYMMWYSIIFDDLPASRLQIPTGYTKFPDAIFAHLLVAACLPIIISAHLYHSSDSTHDFLMDQSHENWGRFQPLVTPELKALLSCVTSSQNDLTGLILNYIGRSAVCQPIYWLWYLSGYTEMLPISGGVRAIRTGASFNLWLILNQKHH